MKKSHNSNILYTRKITLFVIVILFLITYFASLSVSQVYADEVSLKISPSTFQITAQPPIEIETPFTIENGSIDSIRLKIGYKIINKDASQEGIVKYINDTDNSSQQDRSIFNKIVITDEMNTSLENLELGPKQKKRLKLRLRLSEETPNTDYYFSLIFIHDNPINLNQNDNYINKNDQKSVSTLQAGIALNVFLSAGQTTSPQAIIYDFTTPVYSQSGPIEFVAKIKNPDLHFITPKGDVTITNLFGQKVGKVDIPPSVILAGTTKTLIDNVQLRSNVQSLPKIVWPEKFLLGVYNATLHIAVTPTGPFYTKTIQFVVFPLLPTIGFLLLFTLVVFIMLRVRRKL